MTTVTPETGLNNTPEIFGAEPTAKQLEARARIYAMPLDKLDPAAIWLHASIPMHEPNVRNEATLASEVP